MRRVLIWVLALLLCFGSAAADVAITVTSADGTVTELTAADVTADEPDADDESQADGESEFDTADADDESAEADADSAAESAPAGDPDARAQFIDDIIALAEQKYRETGGKAQRAQYSGDIYICKNFTVYLFRQNCGKYRMAEYPDVPLVIPDNKPKAECTDPVYGALWKDIPASEGNPFYAVETFTYDQSLSMEENRERARDFLKQVQRGDYFQMAAKYYYGTGAHSMIYIADYDPETDTVHWCDSNMKGEKRNGERYGYVQFDAEKPIDWFVDAFCRKKYGATIYRLRDDIIFAP